MNFLSDTPAPAHPAVLEALARANAGFAPSYGGDPLSAQFRASLEALFGQPVEVLLVSSGTASNALALSVLCPPTGAILCHAHAHIANDERGAPEFFTHGGKLDLLSGPLALVDEEALAHRLAGVDRGFVHATPPQVLSVTHLSEDGALYTPGHLARLSEMAHGAGLWLHLDGARLGNALAAGQIGAPDLPRLGVDVLSLGLTKTGAMGCEAIVLFGRARELFPDLLARAKRSGHLGPKARYLAAQGLALVEDGLWLDLAAHANAMADRLRAGLIAGRQAEPLNMAGNVVLAVLAPETEARWQAAGVGFYPWGQTEAGAPRHRLVTSWLTTEEDVNALLAL
jgi:threonine aldolase